MKKLRPECIQAIPGIISSRITCLLNFHVKDVSAHTENHNYVLCFIRVWNLVTYIKGITQTGGFRMKKKSVKQDTWA